MRISINIDRRSSREVERQLLEYARRKGSDMEGAIDELAGDCAKQLASRLQPYGLAVGKMKKFQRSIIAQANRALKNANLSPSQITPAAAHEMRRNSKGQVPRGLNTSGQFKRRPISVADRLAYAERKSEAAGAAKGAWLEAGRRAYPKLKVAKFFTKLRKGGLATKSGQKMKRQVELTNSLDYIRAIMSDNDVQVALSRAYRGFFGKLKRAIEK
jgi:hypothetical protein